MKKIFLSTLVLVIGLFLFLSQDSTPLFGAEKMMDKGVTTKERMETGNTMKPDTGAIKEEDRMKKETGMMKEKDTMQNDTGMMKKSK